MTLLKAGSGVQRAFNLPKRKDCWVAYRAWFGGINEKLGEFMLMCIWHIIWCLLCICCHSLGYTLTSVSPRSWHPVGVQEMLMVQMMNQNSLFLHGEMIASHFTGQVPLHLLFYKRFYLCWMTVSSFRKTSRTGLEPLWNFILIATRQDSGNFKKSNQEILVCSTEKAI